MQRIFLSLLLFVLPGLALAQQTTWAVDAAHSDISFGVDHMVISETEGQFHDDTLDVKADKPDFTDADVKLVIQVGSIDTDNEDRYKHLRSGDFFKADEYPTITIVGKGLKPTGKQDHYTLDAKVTMLGVTKPMELEVEHRGTVKNPMSGKQTAGFRVTGVLDRTDYGLKYNSVMDNGGMLIGEEVRLQADMELMKAS